MRPCSRYAAGPGPYCASVRTVGIDMRTGPADGCLRQTSRESASAFVGMKRRQSACSPIWAMSERGPPGLSARRAKMSSAISAVRARTRPVEHHACGVLAPGGRRLRTRCRCRCVHPAAVRARLSHRSAHSPSWRTRGGRGGRPARACSPWISEAGVEPKHPKPAPRGARSSSGVRVRTGRQERDMTSHYSR